MEIMFFMEICIFVFMSDFEKAKIYIDCIDVAKGFTDPFEQDDKKRLENAKELGKSLFEFVVRNGSE